MPPLENVIRVVQHNESLDHSADDECNRSETCLPSQSRDPANHVAKKPLRTSWCEFGNPMILTSSGRRPDYDSSVTSGKIVELDYAYMEAISAIEAKTNK